MTITRVTQQRVVHIQFMSLTVQVKREPAHAPPAIGTHRLSAPQAARPTAQQCQGQTILPQPARPNGQRPTPAQQSTQQTAQKPPVDVPPMPPIEDPKTPKISDALVATLRTREVELRHLPLVGERVRPAGEFVPVLLHGNEPGTADGMSVYALIPASESDPNPAEAQHFWLHTVGGIAGFDDYSGPYAVSATDPKMAAYALGAAFAEEQRRAEGDPDAQHKLLSSYVYREQLVARDGVVVVPFKSVLLDQFGGVAAVRQALAERVAAVGSDAKVKLTLVARGGIDLSPDGPAPMVLREEFERQDAELAARVSVGLEAERGEGKKSETSPFVLDAYRHVLIADGRDSDGAKTEVYVSPGEGHMYIASTILSRRGPEFSGTWWYGPIAI